MESREVGIGGWGDMERKGKTNPAISVNPCKSM